MDADQIINAWEDTLSSKTSGAALRDRRKIARRVKAHEDSLEWGFKQIVRAMRDHAGAGDWQEALEIGLQRMERQVKDTEKRSARLVAQDPNSKLAAEFADHAESEREAVQEYARFAEIYDEVFKPIEAMLRAARREVAARVLAEFPGRSGAGTGDAQRLAEHLRKNTPGEWLEEWDPNEK